MKKTDTVNPLNLPPVQRTAEGLRDALFDELNLVRAGKVDTKHARAVATLAKNIIESAKLELAHRIFLKGIRGVAGEVPLQLGKSTSRTGK